MVRYVQVELQPAQLQQGDFSMSFASGNMRFARLAGVLLIASTLAALIYRFFIVTAILGDVNSSASLSGYQRGMLNLGVVFAAIITSGSFPGVYPVDRSILYPV